jgi:hypothetical protein
LRLSFPSTPLSSLPQKTFFSSDQFDAATIESRRVLLENYLQVSVKNADIVQYKLFQDFIELNRAVPVAAAGDSKSTCVGKGENDDGVAVHTPLADDVFDVTNVADAINMKTAIQ